ncbi:asparaginase [Dyadobacter sediminis]|uniref:asparaginase n=1 Tax=Dyadobacter sediminis TaxID=1493691 RepID=A0A5R9KI24_9BACT|nr:asparaginase [Dyadobacter sediminis]TLU95873.1 asparaginase [Dyadobacter sediminis]GGB77302.1 L-asparaginase 1 [Dyadobacter sediminis]
MTYNKIHIATASPELTVGSVLVIYTGGTLGMVYEVKEKQLVPFHFDQIIERVPEISRLNFDITFLSLNEPIDSSNMNPDIWIELATIIADEYTHYDSFVILHGTDTMAYTASALSYLLEDLNKPVILTGAQLPIGVARSDARENVITALELASARNSEGLPVISEVCVYFNSMLLRGNRSKKQESSNFNAFHSENYPYLANAGVRIEYNWPYIKPFEPGKTLQVQKRLDTNVAFLKMFPGINARVVHSILQMEGLKGVVLETYGAGNATTDQWFLDAVAQAISRGMVLFNVSQCDGGRVAQGHYETSRFLKQVGVVSGSDITAEAAITKMMYVFGRENDPAKCARMLATPLRGEMSI